MEERGRKESGDDECHGLALCSSASPGSTPSSPPPPPPPIPGCASGTWRGLRSQGSASVVLLHPFEYLSPVYLLAYLEELVFLEEIERIYP